MTDTEGEDEVFDGPCVFCGQSVKGSRYVSLGLFFVGSEEGDGLFFTPDEECGECEEWGDFAITRVVHFECIGNYLEGLSLELAHKRRLNAEGDGR